jgi:hypothetical protein
MGFFGIEKANEVVIGKGADSNDLHSPYREPNKLTIIVKKNRIKPAFLIFIGLFIFNFLLGFLEYPFLKFFPIFVILAFINLCFLIKENLDPALTANKKGILINQGAFKKELIRFQEIKGIHSIGNYTFIEVDEKMVFQIREPDRDRARKILSAFLEYEAKRAGI